jgi:hypothetical protein
VFCNNVLHFLITISVIPTFFLVFTFHVAVFIHLVLQCACCCMILLQVDVLECFSLFSQDVGGRGREGIGEGGAESITLTLYDAF